MLTDETYERIAVIAATDTGRGSALLVQPVVDDLRTAAAMLLDAGDDLRVAVLTGFYVPRAEVPAAETDGPLGAVQLAAMVQALGGRATVVTDSFCAPVLQGSLAAAASSAAGPPIGLVVADRAEQVDLDVTHVISIERPGRSADGTYRNMLGQDISQYCPPLDDWFAGAGVPAIAIGDGGNEAGMGRLSPQLVAEVVAHGGQIQSVVSCEALIVGGTSNWGAHALAAAVLASRTEPGLSECLSEAWCLRVLSGGIDAGAVDGVSATSRLSVDDLEWVDYWRIPELLNVIAGESRTA